jgi:uncharacterized protein with PIN domain
VSVLVVLTLLRTAGYLLASFKSSAGKYGFKIDSSLSSLARAIFISTFPTSSSSLASVDADIVTVTQEEIVLTMYSLRFKGRVEEEKDVFEVGSTRRTK